jgi:CBS domain-containing protein
MEEAAMPATPKHVGDLFPHRSLRQILSVRPHVVHAVAPNDPVSLAIQRMAEHNIGLLVVLEGDRLVGVLSERDIVRHAARPDAEAPRDIPVTRLMTSVVASVGSDDTFGRCMALMNEHGIRHLPVLEGDRVIAVLSVKDLLREAVAHHQETLAELERERLAAFQSIG